MKATRWMRPSLAVLVAMLAFAQPSYALLDRGAALPRASLVDADDRAFSLQSAKGKPVLVVYEDKKSAKLNEALKQELSKLAKGDRYRAAVALVPVADVSGYDYWPVRGFVKDAIRSESRKIGATIFCDWDGSFARALDFERGTSTVVLFGKDSRVLFSYAGKVPAAERKRLLELLRLEVEGESDEPEN